MQTVAPATRRLGRTGPTVFPLALGAMGMSKMYGASDDRESVATIQAALERGVNLIDTGDFYGSGHNETLIARALAGRRDRALVSVKFGALRDPSGGWIGVDNRPVAIRNYLAYTLQRLGVDHVDIYRPARLDPAVPIEDIAGAIGDLVKQGYVRHFGLSEVGADTVRRAHAVHPVADVQIEYSLVSRGPEKSILPTLRELGIGLTAYGVLSRGLLSGSKPTGPADFRAYLPRFSGENLARNQRLVDALALLAKARGATTSQLAIAWVLARGADIVPIPGTKRVSYLEQNLAAEQIALTAAELARLDELFPAGAAAGERYGAIALGLLDR
jgi:aryl-alcohol dehydrogenase-like predicted oxidoreductase